MMYNKQSTVRLLSALTWCSGCDTPFHPLLNFGSLPVVDYFEVGFEAHITPPKVNVFTGLLRQRNHIL